MEKKALIAMSGGVDSTTAALLVQQAGYETAGVMLRLTEPAKIKDEADAVKAAQRLGIPFQVLPMEDAFQQEVMERFVSAYEQGETPNPCVDCNRTIKFGRLLDWALEQGYSHLASGHYARIQQENGRWLLKKGLDPKKDQSYMLWSLTQHQLSHLLFPLGELTKDQVREMAGNAGLENASKGDSQDICFIPDGDYASFICRFRGKTFPPGDFVGVDGQVYGKHKGIIHYTTGQRKGLGLSFPQPMYVQQLRMAENQVVLCPHEQLFSTTLFAKDINFISVDSLPQPMEVTAKIRYHHQEQPATVEQVGENMIKVVFHAPQRAITKGQSLVLYQGDVVVGGGKICAVGCQAES